MKVKVPKALEQARVKKGPMASTALDGFNGVFVVRYKRYSLNVVCSNRLGWDHVSVSHKSRCPTWFEMCHVKDLFFYEHETVLQFHPAKSEYINIHPYTLHLWRCQDMEYQLPPSIMV